MKSPCWGCEKRVATPNCHGTCREYAAFLEKVKERRKTSNDASSERSDLYAARSSFWRISKQIKNRAKGDRKG